MLRRRQQTIVGLTLLALAPAFAVVGAACLDRPDAAELLVQPVVATRRDANVDFASFRTFAMTESIPLVNALDAGASDATVSPAIAIPTLDEISAQLVSRHYDRVTRTEGPDLGVAVTAVTRLNVLSLNYGAWWGGGAASGGYWGYPGALGTTIGYAGTIAWQSGTLVIELYDLRAARAAPTTAVTIPVVWAAIVHGVLGEAGASLDAPPTKEVRQAFAQSPYLTRPIAPFMPLEVP